MSKISDFSQSEAWAIRTTLKERCGGEPELQLADSEIRPSAADRDLTTCPDIMRQAEGRTFIVFKTGNRRYRYQFFYQPYKPFGTGVREYDDLGECTVALLQAQAGPVAEERGDLGKKRRCSQLAN